MRQISIFISLIFCGLLIFSSCSNNKIGKTKGLRVVQVGDISFYEGPFGDLLDKAELMNKPIFVDFTASWCLPCKQMEKFVFTDKILAKQLNENFLCYKSDADSQDGRVIQTVFDLGVVPSTLFLDKSGDLLIKNEGYTDAQTLLNSCKRVN